MASIPITIQGIMFYTGLDIGGGPMPGGLPGQPPVGGSPPHPAFPIWGPPGVSFPDKPGYPPTVGGGPIIPPDQPPTQPPNGGPPATGPDGEPIPVTWKTGWTPDSGWVVVGVPTGAHPAPSTT